MGLDVTPAKRRHVAVVGAGIAGSACSQVLLRAGHRVQVFDKSRGPGGRMATRTLRWVDGAGSARCSQVNHGVPGFVASSTDFRRFVREAGQAGQLLPWNPRVDPAGWALDDKGLRYVPVPDMPQLCRHLLDGVETHWQQAVQAMQHSTAGWQLQVDGRWQDETFDAVLLALPPAQAAPLLADHHREWAMRASLALMQPCWTLMGVSLPGQLSDLPWQVARPTRGPLAWLARADGGPGRCLDDARQAHTWVAHARPAWSREHLDAPAAWVQAQLQEAVADWLACPLVWQHAVVHRWRYAMPAAVGTPHDSQCWWQPSAGLGVCGDFLGGQGANGVEGAWLSGHQLASAFLVTEGAATSHAVKPRAGVLSMDRPCVAVMF